MTTTVSKNKLGVNRPMADDDLAMMQANWAHWEGNAKQYGCDHSASWGDKCAIELEIESLLQQLSPGGRWLDAGCANGYTTFRALAGGPDEIHALDFSPTMIGQARKVQSRFDPDRRISFTHGNVLGIDEPDISFDQAYTIRVLINLPSWNAQQQAIREIHRVLKPGGRYILSEAFSGSRERLNALRRAADLPPLRVPQFNLYLQEERLEVFLAGLFRVEKVVRFSSLYYVATRFLRELAIEPHEPPDYNHPINEFAAGLTPSSRGGDFGIQKVYVLSRH